MNCTEYMDNWLSAQADSELNAQELRLAEEHLAGCPRCSARLAEERALKTIVRQRVPILKAPAELQERIRLALDLAEARERRMAPIVRIASAARRRPWVWAPLAAAAVVAFFIFVPHQRFQPRVDVPVFDETIKDLVKFEARFEPNVPSGSIREVSQSYSDAGMPSTLWDFSQSGYELEGGRLDRMSDGRLVTHTFYSGKDDGILCTRYLSAEGNRPPGALKTNGRHAYYRYKGRSICFSYYPDGGFVCILVANVPLEEFSRDIAAAER